LHASLGALAVEFVRGRELPLPARALGRERAAAALEALHPGCELHAGRRARPGVREGDVHTRRAPPRATGCTPSNGWATPPGLRRSASYAPSARKSAIRTSGAITPSCWWTAA